MELKANTLFIKSCKEEDIVPIFAKVNSSIKSGSYMLKKKISKINTTYRIIRQASLAEPT